MGRFQDLTGMRFGRLTVIERAENGVCCGKPTVRWLCKCDCGNMITTEGHSLKRGRTKSCGCLNREVQKREAKTRAIKHGGSRTRIYHIYNHMKARCLNENNPKYKNYGGRGIKICDEWLEDFSSFQNWSLSNGYDDSLSIDRIDVDGDYCPENCRWADSYMQANNKTTTVRITVDGETHSVSEWMRITGARRDTIMRRMRNGYQGMDIFYRRPKKNA